MKRLKKFFEKGKPLIAYITAGYPTHSQTEELIKKMIDRGVKIFELGVPFSDPVADGEVIQHAMRIALEQGGNIEKTLQLAKRIREYNEDVALLIMSYSNPVYKYGYERFVEFLKHNDLDGAIVPDLPIEEGNEFYSKMRKNNLAAIQFLTPLTEEARAKKILNSATGFVYAISHPGITGSAFTSDDIKIEFLKKIKALNKRNIPVCMGFGIRSKADVAPVWDLIDGYIVGTEIIRAIKENRLEETLKNLI